MGAANLDTQRPSSRSLASPTTSDHRPPPPLSPPPPPLPNNTDNAGTSILNMIHSNHPESRLLLGTNARKRAIRSEQAKEPGAPSFECLCGAGVGSGRVGERGEGDLGSFGLGGDVDYDVVSACAFISLSSIGLFFRSL